MSIAFRHRLYFFFFVSGFCSLVYQIVWTRLAFASFGIITPVLSVVLSMFMLGLAFGSWAGGRSIEWLVRRTGFSAIFFYGAAELGIGLGAFAVPELFDLGQKILLSAGQTNSFQYLFLSALVLAGAILPWCVCMGATFPWMMAYVREKDSQSADSFSFLYFANVLGAMAGTILTALVLVEIFGFRHTLALAAAGNFILAAASAGMGWKARATKVVPSPAPLAAPVTQPAKADNALDSRTPLILFTTGFCAMAMEVVWTRAFTPVLKTQVYSFALIVFTYLGATFVGSLLYRSRLKKGFGHSTEGLIALVAITAFLPIVAVDPRFLPTELNLDLGSYVNSTGAVLCVLASICPLCCALGYLTPFLMDQYAGGNPAAAGRAYGINVLGCILGPLCASYLLLPLMSERHVLILLGLPLIGLCLLCRKSFSDWRSWATLAASGAMLVWTLCFANDFEGLLNSKNVSAKVRRDYAASVISYGKGFDRRLLVNGIGMTRLTPETKFMVHLPMAFHHGQPESALIICFGMGTSFRSALSWDVRTTQVELVPSVVDAFDFFHADTAAVRANPKGHIVIDDGRRYLERTRDKYDVIVVDPPPPMEAAGSSLLYSPEFYALAKEHLNSNGIMQVWIPAAYPTAIQAALRSLHESFFQVIYFSGVHGWGAHFLASMQPIEPATGAELVARMPPKARQDLEEWMNPKVYPTLADYFQPVLAHAMPLDRLLNPDPQIQITDDRPFNEYFLLRRWRLYAP